MNFKNLLCELIVFHGTEAWRTTLVLPNDGKMESFSIFFFNFEPVTDK
jgi:hypothetical protein